MKQQRVDLWSAASYAVSPPQLREEHGAPAAPDHLLPRLARGVLRGATSPTDLDVARSLATTEGRLACQDQDGLAGEVLLPDPDLVEHLLDTGDPGLERAGCEAHNQWSAVLQAGAPDRIVAVGQIPTTGLDDAMAALEQAQSLGLRAVALAQPPAGPGTTPADGDDFWRRAADRTVVVLGSQYGGGSFTARVQPAVGAGRPAPHVAFLTRLALTGIWDDVPDLRVVIAGVNAGWIPYVLQAADTNYLRTRASRPVNLRQEDALPSEYVRRHTFATFGDDRAAALATSYFGVAHLLWSAATPTALSAWPNDEEQAARLTMGLTTEIRRAVLGENCRRVFRIEGVSDFTDAELDDFEHPVLV